MPVEAKKSGIFLKNGLAMHHPDKQVTYVCALESGSSKTLWWIADASGTLLAKQTGIGAANIHDEQIVRGILTPILQTALMKPACNRSQIARSQSLGD